MILNLSAHQSQPAARKPQPRIINETNSLLNAAIGDIERAAAKVGDLITVSRWTVGDLADLQHDLQLALLSLQIASQLNASEVQRDV